MHRITRADGSTTQSDFVRWALTMSYAMFTLAGALLIVSPETHNVYGHSALWMSWFVTLGGLACTLGNATRRWVGEFVGGPLLIVGLAVLGMEVWLNTHDAYPLIAMANLALFLGIAGVGVARWRIVHSMYQFAHAVALAERRHVR